MDPVMIEIGPVEIRWYGVLLTAAIFIGYYLAQRRLTRLGQDPELFESMAFWAVFIGFAGARAVYVLTNLPDFAGNFWEVFAIWHGGISFHGGILAGGLVFWYFARRYKLPFYLYADSALPGVAIGIIAGRIGNFMNGSDTVGRLTSLPIGFTWPEWASGFPGICVPTNSLAFGYCAGEVVRGPVHLTQFYGLLVGAILLAMVYYWFSRNRPAGYAFWGFVFWYSLLRSVIEEPFRLNPLWWQVYENSELGIGLFTATQLASVPLMILGLYLMLRVSHQPETTSPKRGKA